MQMSDVNIKIIIFLLTLSILSLFAHIVFLIYHNSKPIKIEISVPEVRHSVSKPKIQPVSKEIEIPGIFRQDFE